MKPPALLTEAIVKVWDAMEHYGEHPGADSWVLDREVLGPRLVGRIRAAWFRLAGEDSYERWPYRDDYVLCQWVAYRKMTNHKKQEIRRGLCLPAQCAV